MSRIEDALGRHDLRVHNDAERTALEKSIEDYQHRADQAVSLEDNIVCRATVNALKLLADGHKTYSTTLHVYLLVHRTDFHLSDDMIAQVEANLEAFAHQHLAVA